MDGQKSTNAGQDAIDKLLVEIAYTREMQLKTLLTVASDSLRRARDGVPEQVVFQEHLDYTIGQIIRTQKALVECLAKIGAWRATFPAQVAVK